MNQELYNKFKYPDFASVIKVGRLKWVGHVVRMDGERKMEKLLEGKLQKSFINVSYSVTKTLNL